MMPLHLMAQKEIHTATTSGGCAVTLKQEQTNLPEPVMLLTQHSNVQHSLPSLWVHDNHILYRTAAGVANVACT